MGIYVKPPLIPPHIFLKLKICRQEVLLLGNEIAFNEAIIEEREQGIMDIQNEIGQANEIFKDLAVLVHDQGVVIGKILNPRQRNSFIYSSFFLANHGALCVYFCLSNNLFHGYR